MRLESVCSIPVEDYLLTRVLFTPDGRYVLTGHRDLTLHAILSGRSLLRFPFEGFLAEPSFSEDSCYLGCVNRQDHHPATHGLAKVYDLASGDVVFETEAAQPFETACFMPLGSGTAFCYRQPDPQGDVLRAVSMDDRRPAGDIPLPGWSVQSLTTLGDRLALYGGHTAPSLFEVEGAQFEVHPLWGCVRSFPGGELSLERSLGVGLHLHGWTPRSGQLAFETRNFRTGVRCLALLDLVSGECGELLRLPPDVIPSVSFSMEGQYLGCLAEEADGDNVLSLFDCSTRRLLWRTAVNPQYHTLAVHMKTWRVALLGAGKCDVALVHPLE